MIFNLTGPVIGGSAISAPIIGKDFNWSGGDGTYQVLDDGDGNWRIKFLSSGTFTPLKNMVIDVFLVGGGGGGLENSSYSAYYGGGGGYTTTVTSIVLSANTEYAITIGAGGAGKIIASNVGNANSGGTSSAFSASASGGGGAGANSGGNGGSGGGGSNQYTDGIGGSDGGNGTGYYPGHGQGKTTREFGEATGTLYSNGGDGVYGATAASSNTGDGGQASVAGGSGIVVIRQHKEVAA